MAGGERPVRVGLIGAGAMGSRHARVVHESAKVELSCVVDPDQLVGTALAAAYGGAWLPDLDGTDVFDAVIVASSTETHHHWVQKALALGKPVLVEKPLSTEIDQTRAMVDAAAGAGIPLMCGFVERFNPAVLRAKELLGTPLYIQAERHAPYARRVRSGVAYDLAIHDVDLAVQFFGHPPETVSGRFGYVRPESAPGAEDLAELHLQYKDGTGATVSASRIAPGKVRTIAIIESGRHIEIDLTRHHLAIHRHDGEAVRLPAISRPAEPLAAQLEHFLGLVHGAIDADAERRGVLHAHEVVAASIAGSPFGTPPASVEVGAR